MVAEYRHSGCSLYIEQIVDEKVLETPLWRDQLEVSGREILRWIGFDIGIVIAEVDDCIEVVDDRDIGLYGPAEEPTVRTGKISDGKTEFRTHTQSEFVVV